MKHFNYNPADPLIVDKDGLFAHGQSIKDQYNSASPFPHIVLKDFLPEATIDELNKGFPQNPALREDVFDRAQERLKVSYNPDILSPQVRQIFNTLNSQPFIQFLEQMTGISGLIPDHWYEGAGFHETLQGGHLNIHTDFNLHKKLNLERRLNLLIYLNDDWENTHGGCLELWDQKMGSAKVTVVPRTNTCVVFSTTDSSFHGHPVPTNHPQSKPRRSLALYYYTATWSEHRVEHTTQFKVRPGSEDKFDYQVRLRSLLKDLVPPLLARRIRQHRSSI